MEKTNQELYDKMIEAFNIVLNNTSILRKDTFEIIDKINPNYHNIRSLHDKYDEINDKIEKIENTIKIIEKKIDILLETNTK